mgnify:CR=1 FL=1
MLRFVSIFFLLFCLPNFVFSNPLDRTCTKGMGLIVEGINRLIDLGKTLKNETRNKAEERISTIRKKLDVERNIPYNGQHYNLVPQRQTSEGETIKSFKSELMSKNVVLKAVAAFNIWHQIYNHPKPEFEQIEKSAMHFFTSSSGSAVYLDEISNNDIRDFFTKISPKFEITDEKIALLQQAHQINHALKGNSGTN